MKGAPLLLYLKAKRSGTREEKRDRPVSRHQDLIEWNRIGWLVGGKDLD